MAKFQVNLVSCDDYFRLADAFEELKQKEELARFASQVQGKKVLVKPNLVGSYPPERNVTTNPELVRLIVRWLRQAGAEVIVGDNCGIGGYGINERAAKKSGILEASEGAYLNLAKEIKEIEVHSRFFSRLTVSRAFLEVDYIVSVPKLKTHTLTVLTVGIKNMFGMLAGASKSRVHSWAPAPDDFGEALVDIFQIRSPDLTIVDAVMGMDKNGPNFGRVRPIGYLIAGENAVAVDLVITRILGIAPEWVHHLKVAMERGLGPDRIEQVEFPKKLKEVSHFVLPSTIARRRFSSLLVNRYLYQPIVKSRLVLNYKKCTGCKSCVKACPTGAMSGKGEYPEIDQARCIRCFCCYELCEEGAWEIAGFLKWLVGRLV